MATDKELLAAIFLLHDELQQLRRAMETANRLKALELKRLIDGSGPIYPPYEDFINEQAAGVQYRGISNVK